MRELRDDQKAALEQLRAAVKARIYRIVMQAPTGYGKTVLAAALVESALSKKGRVLFTVPALSLIDQTVEMFYGQGITDVGVIQANHMMTDWAQPVQIASVQTLMRRELPNATVIMIDEVHRWFTFYEQMLMRPELASVPIIGLSATPWTKGLGAYFHSPHIIASSTQQLIDDGLLAPFKVYAPSHPDLEGMHTSQGDYVVSELEERMDQPALVADVVETWLKHADGRPTLCFGVDRAHAKHLQQRFIEQGIPSGYQDAYTKDVDSERNGEFVEGRKAIKKKFHDGTYKVVCNVGTLTTGVDWDVRCIVMARPTKSEMLFVQIVGRGLRTAAGKDHCLILDHSDNHLRLGFVTDVDASHTVLHDGKTHETSEKETRIRLPKECPACSFLKPPHLAKCPACGFVAVAVNNVEEEDGELVEIKPNGATMAEKRIVFAELRAYGRDKGYKDGWAANKYRDKFGVWPANSFRDDAPAEIISTKTAAWIKREIIKWAKSKRRAEWQRDNGERRYDEAADRAERDEAAIRRVREQFGTPPAGSALMRDEDWDVKI